MDASKREPRTLRDYVSVMRRRKWVVLLCLITVPLASMVLAMRQTPVYAASADVLLSRQNLGNQLQGIQDPTQYLQAERFAQTQADLAEVGEVAQRTLDALALTDRTAAEILSAVTVKARPNADILTFRALDGSPTLASQIATEYARQYTQYRKEIDTAALQRAETEVTRQMRQIEGAGSTNTDLYNSLVDKNQQLKTMELLTANALLFRPADAGVKVAPRPMKAFLMGLVLGILGGLGLAFLWEALDTRVRTAE